MPQHSHCWAYTLRKPELKETHVCTPVFITALFTIARHGTNLDVHWQMNGLEICGTYTQWNITQLLKRMHLSQF